MLAASMLGEVLGHYRVTATLDAGGMGSVYRAEHLHLGRPAAIKLLHPELTANREYVQRFFNEAKAATAIRHPGIVEVYDVGYTPDGRAYFVMELLEGQSLRKRRQAAGGRLAEADAARLAAKIATVLEAAHRTGIVHRDLKPDNIFLVAGDEGERVKVLDFGVAKLADVFPAETRHTQTGALMGTPVYMAPEQARSAAAIDARADLYSLGCILYELLAGVPPFEAEGAGEIIALQMFAPPQPLSQRLERVTPELEAVVLKLLEKEPQDRYQSAGEVIAALGALQLATALAAERRDANMSAPRFTYTPGAKQLTVPVRPDGPTSGTLADERPTELAPAKKSTMPIIAAVATVVLAGGAAIFALARGGGDETPASDAGVGSQAAAAPADAASPPAKKPAKHGDGRPAKPVERDQKPVDDIRVVDDGARTAPKKPKQPSAKPETATQTPVTRPDVEPLHTPTQEDLRTPITKRPLEGSLDDPPPEGEKKSP